MFHYDEFRALGESFFFFFVFFDTIQCFIVYIAHDLGNAWISYICIESSKDAMFN